MSVRKPKEFIVETNSFHKTIKAFNWQEAIISAFIDMPEDLGVLTKITVKNESEQYISTIAALKIAGYIMIDK